MERLLTSINVAMGTILVAIGLFFPFFQQGIFTDVKQSGVEEVVRRIAEEERSVYRKHSRFFYFTLEEHSVNFPNNTVNLASALQETGYHYEAYPEGSGYLVIRAQPAKATLLAALLKPQVYTFRTHPNRNDEKMVWSSTTGL